MTITVIAAGPRFLALLFALVVSGTLATGEIRHELTPKAATDEDEISLEIVIPSAHLSSCYFTNHTVSREGSAFMIDLTTDRRDGICLQVISDARVNAQLGQLEPGTYEVTINHRSVVRPPGGEPESVTFSFRVYPAQPRLEITPRLELSFETIPGRFYQLMCSPDLEAWRPCGEVIEGDGERVVLRREPANAVEFFRVVATRTRR
jgi:hypothetical protein